MAAINGFNIRTEKLKLFSGLSKNKLFVEIAIGIFAGVILACTFIGQFISLCPLTLTQWLSVFALSLIVIPIDLIRKLIMIKKNI